MAGPNDNNRKAGSRTEVMGRLRAQARLWAGQPPRAEPDPPVVIASPAPTPATVTPSPPPLSSTKLARPPRPGLGRRLLQLLSWVFLIKPKVLIIERYLWQETFGHFMLGAMGFTFFMVITTIFALGEKIFSKNIPPFTVAKVLLLSAPQFLVLAIPVAVVFSTLMAMGRLNRDNEIIAMQTNGISLYRIFIPFITLAMLAGVLSWTLFEKVVPPNASEYIGVLKVFWQAQVVDFIKPGIVISAPQNKYFYVDEIRKEQVEVDASDAWSLTAPKWEFPAGLAAGDPATFAELWQKVPQHSQQLDAALAGITAELNKTLKVGAPVPRPDDPVGSTLSKWTDGVERSTMYNIRLYDYYIEGQGRLRPYPRIFVAQRAWVEDQFLVLSDVVLYNLDERTGKNLVSASMPEVKIDIATKIEDYSLDAQPQQLTWRELRDRVLRMRDRLASSGFMRSNLQAGYLMNWTEYYLKFSIPFACISFVLVAVPVSLRGPRDERNMGMILTFGLVMAYYIVFFTARTLGSRGVILVAGWQLFGHEVLPKGVNLLPPYVAGWLAPGLFLLAAIPLLLRARK